jgi:hypothetical protein
MRGCNLMLSQTREYKLQESEDLHVEVESTKRLNAQGFHWIARTNKAIIKSLLDFLFLSSIRVIFATVVACYPSAAAEPLETL